MPARSAACAGSAMALTAPWHTSCPLTGRRAVNAVRDDRISEHTTRVTERAPEETNMALSIITRLQSIVRREEGQDLLEYALLVALIALVAVGAIGLAGKNVNTIFGNIANQ